jgi:hypothetical protein
MSETIRSHHVAADPRQKLEVYAAGCIVTLSSLQFHRLKPIWDDYTER